MHKLYFDGAASPNPGQMGLGVSVQDNTDIEIAFGSKPAGFGTNNEAEYKALIWGLEESLHLGIDSICAFGDSQLIVNQVSGKWEAGEKLISLKHYAVELAGQFKEFDIRWVKRANNHRADELSKRGLTLREKEFTSKFKAPNAGYTEPLFLMRLAGKKVIFIESGAIVIIDLITKRCGCHEFRRTGQCKHMSALKTALGVRSCKV